MQEDTRRPSNPSSALTRRQFARRLTGMAGALAAGSRLDADAQESPKENAPMPAADDPRIALLEKERGLPLSAEQRSGLPAQLKDLDEGRAALRKFALHDGDSEPCFLFAPLAPTSDSNARKGGKRG